MLLPYQARVAADNSRVKVIEKSRRIGISWGAAAIAAINAAKRKGRDLYYVGYNREMAEQFIHDTAWWARAYQLAASAIEQEILRDEDKDIFVYRVRFASGYKVQALSSNPANLRAKKGDILIDELAFHEQPEELLKAAMATLMWGYSVQVISTHNGVKNFFNKLVCDVRSQKLDYSLHRITLDDAISEGLYQRICFVNNWEWSGENEIAWRDRLYKDYGIGADEELGCIPLDVKGGGKVFQRQWFEIVEKIPPYFDLKVRFWDMAATPKEINQNSYYTAGVLLGFYGDDCYVLHAIAQQLSPSDSDDLIVAIARQDSWDTLVRWEEEGGSAGKHVTSYLKERLYEFDANGIKPSTDKLSRAKPVASEAKQGKIKILKGIWNNEFLDALHGFDGTPQPLINDYTDALSGAYSCRERSRIVASSSAHTAQHAQHLSETLRLL